VGWAKEALVGIFGEFELDATAGHAPGASLTLVGLFTDATVGVPAGCRVSGRSFSLFGDRQVDVARGDGDEIRINAYGLFCDLNVIEEH